MRLATGDQITEQPAQPTGRDSAALAHQNQHTNETEALPLPESYSSEDQNYLAILARATKDAVRDLDLKSGRLVWPQGLKTLLGYEPAETNSHVSFWQECVHPEDYTRIAAAIRGAAN